MIMRLVRSLLVAGAVLSGPSCAPQGIAGGAVPYQVRDETAVIEKAIAQRATEFSAAVVRASAAGWTRTEVMSLADIYTEETILFPPRGAPIRGRLAVQQYWTRTPDRRILAHHVVPERIDTSNDLVAEHGRFHLTSQVGTASPVSDSATYVSVWRRDSDGVWRKHLDSWW
jgi:ketosteroid isomerase-like protein